MNESLAAALDGGVESAHILAVLPPGERFPCIYWTEVGWDL